MLHQIRKRELFGRNLQEKKRTGWLMCRQWSLTPPCFMGPMIWGFLSGLCRCSIPPQKINCSKKIAGLCRNIDWGLSKPCNSAKINHYYFSKGSFISLQTFFKALTTFFQNPGSTPKHQHKKRWNSNLPEVLICVDNLLLFGKYGRSPTELDGKRPTWCIFRGLEPFTCY